MRLVLDSNEYVVGFGTRSDTPPARLLAYLTAHPADHLIFASRTIFEEVRRNLDEASYREFWTLLMILDVATVEPWEIPESLQAKYVALGLKHGDAAIAACADVAGAEAVITENRDFHGRAGLPFRPLRAEEFLKEQEQKRDGHA